MSQIETGACHRDMEANSVGLRKAAHKPRAVDDFEIFDALYPSLRRFAAVVADLDVDPDDLVQDAVLAVLERQNLGEIDNPQAYLKRAIVNLSANRRRRAGLWRSLIPRLREAEQTEDSYPSDLGLLDELDPLDRAIVFLSDVEGLGHRAIAAQLGLSDSATRKRASRARTQIRALLHDNERNDR